MAASENTQTGNFEICSQRLLILTTINKLNTQRLQKWYCYHIMKE